MIDTTVKKVSAAHSPKGEMGRTYLVSGKRLSMRLWWTGPEDSEKAPSHVNPLGAKGVAEIAICGVAPAIANAVYHATGRRVRELPITPERLLL
jgi:hypothetical protein